jgi:hypothetical protein
MTGYGFGLYSESDPHTIKVLPNSGHLRITVSPNEATVDYVRSDTTVGGINGQITYSYIITAPEPGSLGDVNGDSLVNSTDALIILFGDVGIGVSQFCPMNCGDVNADGFVNSTDALIVLSYDADMTVPYPVGEPGCPASVTPCAGCTP